MQERGWWKEGEGVEERVPGRWSPAFRINTSTASLLGVRQVVSSPPFPRPFIPLALALTFPVAFVLSCFPSLPPAGPSFFLSPAATRIVVHRPVILCRSHSKPPSSSSSSSSCFAFLLPTFHLALHPEVSPLSLSLSLRTLQIFPISFLRPLFRSTIPPSFLVHIADFSLLLLSPRIFQVRRGNMSNPRYSIRYVTFQHVAVLRMETILARLF